MITLKFIKKVHEAFDELNYHEKEQLDFDAFVRSATRTITHSKELPDAVNAVLMFQFCLKKWKKIEKMFSRKLQIFNKFEFEGNSLISVVSDEEAFGAYYVTNGIKCKAEEIYFASQSIDEGLFNFGFNKGRFTAFENSNYYLKFATLSSRKMKLFDNSNNCLCTIVLSKDYGIFLENNLTPYYIIINDGVIYVFDRKYIENLSEGEDIEIEKCLADIEWDILEKNSDLGLAELSVYTPDHDLEILLLFASSTFLLYHKYRQAQRAAIMSFMASTWAFRR